MFILQKTGWYLYAALITVLTLGIYPRFHLITIRKTIIGGVRAGNFGCTHVYLDTGGKHLVISRMFSRQYMPLAAIAYVNKHPISVQLESSGGKRVNIATVQARQLEEYITLQSRIYWKTQPVKPVS